MASVHTVSLDCELAEKLSMLSTAQKRELLDFASFLASRRRVRTPKRLRGASLDAFAAIIDIAPGGKGETDISVNHDKYLYGDHAL